MAIKKSELYSSLWKSCDELRGGMDATRYKDYVLVILFVKYVSDKFHGKEDSLIYVPDGGSFKDLVALKGKSDIGDKMNTIIHKLAEENDLKGVIDVADFNDSDQLGRGKEKVDRLSDLIAIFENPQLNFSKNHAGDDDILGDAYEFLMRHFATESGKSKGQFYTPSEVSRVVAKVVGIDKTTKPNQTLYDFACGSGSLLIKSADESPVGISIYGQEMDNATYALARMNMMLHGYETHEIWRGNTLSAPYWKNKETRQLKTFDYIVANPPFSSKKWTSGFAIDDNSKAIIDDYDRFKGYGTPPNKNGDYAFFLHLLKSLKNRTGKAAVILPHGVLFRGNSEAIIRENIIKKGYIKAIIGLPANLFYGTGIPACIIVIDKENANARKGIFMMDASKEFIKDGNKNRLRERDIHKIVDTFSNFSEIPKYSRMVLMKEIQENEYNLNIPRYIDIKEEEDVQDIEAHLKGGIPKADVEDLQDYWKVYATLKNTLFKTAKRTEYYDMMVSKELVKPTIFEHPEFQDYGADLIDIFNNWELKNKPLLWYIDQTTKPKELIHTISENVLTRYTNVALIDKYSVYQIVMNYWFLTMRDDVYLLVEDDWTPQLTFNEKKGTWDSDLIPKELIIQKYFPKEQKAIDTLETKKEKLVQQMQELQEEHSGEEGLLEEVINDKGKITKTNITARLKEIKNDPDFKDEEKILKSYLKLFNDEGLLKKKIKEAILALDKLLLKKYRSLSVEEIKILVVEDKWLTVLKQNIETEMDSISQRLANRIEELASRYENPLPILDTEVKELERNVTKHLNKMGFLWN